MKEKKTREEKGEMARDFSQEIHALVAVQSSTRTFLDIQYN
jgi:hypothetical protein